MYVMSPRSYSLCALDIVSDGLIEYSLLHACCSLLVLSGFGGDTVDSYGSSRLNIWDMSSDWECELVIFNTSRAASRVLNDCSRSNLMFFAVNRPYM